ncbi:class I SAM-dependent methyltransferase [Desulfovibrio ferrophilus]|uniref:Methyltransferase type 11 n=1 Tax=Desulfovibrio ferrophilus TaxID=241368 RepID=A0A2Z6B1I2_9BACT|nr:class I SAM-dependent methyltransferase [Desulfovibrio ferrophilus]BBD09325.1 methyltransferase type 11 [Desulfovibrio ferrophilus]
MWDAGWEKLFQSRDWGKYPDIEVVRFVARNYFSADCRSAVNILEIGCGTGANLWFIAREGFTTHGRDGSSSAINKLRHRLEGQSLDAKLTVGDVNSLPYPDASMDAVIDCECLYANSMEDSKAIVAEITRVLKPSGKLFSMTFGTDTHGNGMGESIPGEPNTYSSLSAGAIRNDCGVVRFSSRGDLDSLYGSQLTIQSVDYVIRSVNGGPEVIQEWVVVAQKPFGA